MQILEVSSLALAYDGVRVVENLSFSLERGSYLCIIGENGTGKSTLLRGLLGLLPTAAGTITWQGIAEREIGYLPQQTLIQRDFPASVEEVVRSGGLNRRGLHPFAGKAERARVEENLSRLGLTALRRRCYRELSGGQQQRVLLARALCATSAVLLLDEPAAGLDPLVSGELYRLIASLHREGLTVLMVTHDLGEPLDDATHVLHLRRSGAHFSRRADWHGFTESGTGEANA